MRLVDEVGQLRTRRRYRALLVAMCEGKKRFGFRLCHYTVQGNHLHLVVEADSALALSRGMKGLGVRIARGLNKELGRKGRVVADRYHARALGTPAEVKNALAYVYGNARVHARRRGGRGPMGVDGYTSWGTTRGVFADIPEVSGPSGWEVMVDFADPPVVPPRSWLLRTGWWLRHGHL